jgi:hypothetical protein
LSFGYNEEDDVVHRELSAFGLEGYAVGTDGTIWSCWRPDGSLREEWRNRKTYVVLGGGTPHAGIKLRTARSESVCFYVHQLVLQAFDGKCPPGMECRHLDGDPLNNNLENLAWGTHKANMADKKRHGTSRNGTTKLHASDIADIREARKRGVSARLLALLYEVTEDTITEITCGRTWKHVAM